MQTVKGRPQHQGKAKKLTGLCMTGEKRVDILHSDMNGAHFVLSEA